MGIAEGEIKAHERERELERYGQRASGGSGGKLALLAGERHVKQLVGPHHLLYWP